MRPASWVLGALVVRQTLDLCTGLGQANRIGTALLLVALAAVVLRQRSDPPVGPPLELTVATSSFVFLVGLGALGAVSLPEAARLGLLYSAPVLVALAVWRTAPTPVEVARAACIGAVLPVLTSLGALAMGQQHALISHGYPRLTGLYANHHTLALTAALTVLFAAFLVPREQGWRRWATATLGVAALLCMAATYVRTAGVLLAVVAVTWLALERRWRTLAAVGGAGVVAIAASPGLRNRLGDLVAVLTLTAPAGGWEAIGSWRGAIWREVLTAFAERGPGAWLAGTGLGGHLQLWHKPLDPHSEPLTLLVQLGIAGPLCWLACHWAAAHQLVVARRPERSFALALLAGALITCLISNTFLARATPGWLLWAFVAAAALPARKIS
ncbi:MAG: O-antigen ligase [Myxococcota bacterium]|jgi:O-antigen ligase